jgi:hypothetical protein
MNTPLRSFTLPLALWGLALCAQVRSDKALELNGAAPADRQVQQLGAAQAEGDALNAATLQAAGYRFAQASSGDAWTAQLDPPLSALSAGLRLVVQAGSDNTGPVTLDVDDLGPVPVLGGDGPLIAGEARGGELLSLVFDGNAFQVINGRPLPRKPCPSGTVAVNELYCIEPVQHDTTDYPTASVFCAAQNMQLCSWGQWYVACAKSTQLGITDMVGDWEWTNSAGNSDTQARVVGQSSCTHAGVTYGWDSEPRAFRCCYRR